MNTATKDAAAPPWAAWFTQWAEQQRQWTDALSPNAQAAESPFAPIAAAMAAAMGTLPCNPLAPQGWSGLPSMAEALLGRIDTAPTLAPLSDFDRKTAAASAAWWRLQEAQLRYRTLVDSVWPAVQQAVAKRHAQGIQQHQTATPRAGTDLWLDALNAALLELMRTPAYLKAQRETLDTGLAYREAMATIAADICQWLQLPAREEVDDLARALVELRREVRAKKQTRSEDTPSPRAARASARRRTP